MPSASQQAVFFDRDGVLFEIVFRNGRLSVPYYWGEVKILPQVSEALLLLKARGFLQIVLTNQPEIGRGTLSPQALDNIHRKLRIVLPTLDEIFVCPHVRDDQCHCKKPEPGLVREAIKKWNIDLSKSYIIGDRWCDIELGKILGMTTILVESPAGKEDVTIVHPDYFAASLFTAAQYIVNDAKNINKSRK